MAMYEVRDQHNLAVRVDALSEEEALWLAIEVAPELDEGSLYVVDGPVGQDGDDAP